MQPHAMSVRKPTLGAGYGSARPAAPYSADRRDLIDLGEICGKESNSVKK